MEQQQIDPQKVWSLVSKYFNGKVDKGGAPYVGHLSRVASNLLEHCSYKAYIVGLLHDILEDTDCTIEELREVGCDDEIIEAIKSVTRNKNEKYFDFIKRAKQNNIGKVVKIYDLMDNMNITRLSEFGDYEQKRLLKYWKSYKYLCDEIDELE